MRSGHSGTLGIEKGTNPLLALRSCVISGLYGIAGSAGPRQPERLCHQSDVHSSVHRSTAPPVIGETSERGGPQSGLKLELRCPERAAEESRRLRVD